METSFRTASIEAQKRPAKTTVVGSGTKEKPIWPLAPLTSVGSVGSRVEALGPSGFKGLRV